MQLRAARLPGMPAEREVPVAGRSSAQHRLSPGQVRDRAAEAFYQSIDRYARAWVDAWRMQVKALPVLEHQKTELKVAGAELDTHRPGARQDLHTALRHEPAVMHAMVQFERAQRTRDLLAGIEHAIFILLRWLTRKIPQEWALLAGFAVCGGSVVVSKLNHHLDMEWTGTIIFALVLAAVGAWSFGSCHQVLSGRRM